MTRFVMSVSLMLLHLQSGWLLCCSQISTNSFRTSALYQSVFENLSELESSLRRDSKCGKIKRFSNHFTFFTCVSYNVGIHYIVSEHGDPLSVTLEASGFHISRSRIIFQIICEKFKSFCAAKQEKHLLTGGFAHSYEPLNVS